MGDFYSSSTAPSVQNKQVQWAGALEWHRASFGRWWKALEIELESSQPRECTNTEPYPTKWFISRHMNLGLPRWR